MAKVTAKMSVVRAARQAERQDAKGREVYNEMAGEAANSHRMFTSDSFQNLALKLGIGADNALTGSTYGYYPITRIRVLLEWIHRGSWLGGVAVDCVADDMVRAGIEITSTMKPDDVQKLDQAMISNGVWRGVNETIKWGRLYGGAVGYMVIDGQDPATPLRIDAIAKSQFKGIMVFDRWMLNPSLNKLVFDPLWGWVPESYDTMTGYANGVPRMKFHYTRCFRMEGIRLPWQQRLTENLWGLSVYERMYDRMVAFDSGTMGVAQSLYKSFLRYLKLEDFRSIASVQGPALEGLARYLSLIQKFQSIEGLTIIDSKDDFGTHQNQTFNGMSEGLLQLGQQLAGALQIPMVRLFGQSPAGLNATGESDLRNYYDGINSQQESMLRHPLTTVLQVQAKSEGIKIPPDFAYMFKPLWQMTPKEKAETAETTTRTVEAAYSAGMISQRVAMSELQQSSHTTGIFTNITPKDLEAAEDLVPTSQGGVDPETGEVVQPIEEEPGDAEADKGSDGDGAGAKKTPARGKGKSAAGGKRSGGKGGGKGGGKKTSDAVPFTVLGTRTLYDDIACVVEQPPGFNRKGDPCDGASPYGYICKTVGMDQENIDCFFGPDDDCFMVWCINQGAHDPEHKIMFHYKRWGDALQAYALAYPDYPPPDGVVAMPIADFKTWLADPNNHGKPAYRPRPAEAAE